MDEGLKIAGQFVLHSLSLANSGMMTTSALDIVSAQDGFQYGQSKIIRDFDFECRNLASIDIIGSSDLIMSVVE